MWENSEKILELMNEFAVFVVNLDEAVSRALGAVNHSIVPIRVGSLQLGGLSDCFVSIEELIRCVDGGLHVVPFLLQVYTE